MDIRLLRQRLTLFSCLLAFAVIGLGAFTRLVDAGLGCPDWPGCYGHLTWPDEAHEISAAEKLFPETPVDTDKTWPEMVHRYFATGLGFVILVLAGLALRDRAHGLVYAFVLLGVVILQGMFGMWTVTLKLWPQVVTGHLLGGFTTLSLLWLSYLRLRQSRKDKAAGVDAQSGRRLPNTLAMFGLIFVVLQIALGGWTTSNYAALACIDLPTCHGEWLPAMDFRHGFNVFQAVGPNYLGGLLDNEARTAIHFSHRIGALAVATVLVLLAMALLRSGIEHLRTLAGVLLLVLVVQIGLGVTNILAALPLAVAVTHNAVGAILLLTLVTINYQIRRHASHSA